MASLEALEKLYLERCGRELEVGPWLTIDQERIERFAAVTGDEQWIHLDVERASREAPGGRTIAHGFLTLSLLPYLTGSNTPEYFARHYPGMTRRLNYGLNKVRFPAPVPNGARIRSHTTVQEVSRVEGGLQIIYLFTIEIEGGSKPACVAEQIFRLFP